MAEADVIISAQVPRDLAEVVRDISKREDRSMSSTVRRLLRQGLDQERQTKQRGKPAISA